MSQGVGRIWGFKRRVFTLIEPLERRRVRFVGGTAFTLIELLVVISIISVLASLLLPSIGRARQRALAMSCTSNLRQLGYAIQLYWDDYDQKINGLSGIFPPTWDGNSTSAWSQLIYPYINSTAPYMDKGRPSWMPELPVGYYLNLLPAFIEGGSPGAGVYTIDGKLIKYPSSFIVFSDDLWISPPQEIDPTNETGDKTGFSNAASNYPPVHAQAANFLFADNHVGSYRYFEFSDMTYWYHTMANWQATKPDP